MMPSAETVMILINLIVAVASAGINLAYFFSHKNGKKHLRLLCSIIMMYFAVMYGAAALGWVEHSTFGAEYLRPFLWVLFLIPVWDARADWNRGA